MEISKFEKLVDEAIEDLPEEFKAAMDNVSIVVEEWPNSRVARGLLLLGLYHGIPKTVWGRWQGLQIPDKITIFRGPIEFLARGDEEKIRKLIIDTVEHEIAHHFGISDKRINEIKRKST
ncbi:MAG: metallopeptidase family protein [Candidatus Curtissbacteria bacterium]|nr:metallopeptidase family protein [Candidatus Curtissbacteria bacterium]